METKPLSEVIKEFESKDKSKKLEEAKPKPIEKKKAKSGDIIVVDSEAIQGEKQEPYHVTVIERKGNSFYFYYSDAKGKPSSKGSQNVAHSNGIFSKDLKKVGAKKFKTGKIKGDEYVITGIPHVDLRMMSLGNTWRIFSNNAPASIMAIYNDNEDINHHAENSKLVADFLAHMVKNGSAKGFSGGGIAPEDIKPIIDGIAKLSEEVFSLSKKFKGVPMSDRLEDIKSKLIYARKEAEEFQMELELK